MKIKNQLMLSLGAPNQAVLAVKQGDIDSRLVECTLLNDGVEETIPEGTAARVAFRKPDGKQVLNDAEISDNRVCFLLTQQMLAAIGEASCEVILTKDEEWLSSAVFSVEIQPPACDGSEIESSPEYQTFANTLLEADGAIAQATEAAAAAQSAAAAANAAAQEAEDTLDAFNISQLSSGSLIKWDGEKLVNSEPKTDYARLGDVYPVGSVYTSVNNVNPSSLFGGTWVSFASGRTLIGVDTAQTEFNTVQKTGGEKTHTLTATEIPSHTHMMIGTRNIAEDVSGPFKTPWSDGTPTTLRLSLIQI